MVNFSRGGSLDNLRLFFYEKKRENDILDIKQYARHVNHFSIFSFL